MIILGKYKEIYNDESLPSIKDYFQETEYEGKNEVLLYLRNGKRGACASGRAKDVVTGEYISDEFCCYSDGVYVWRSDLIYYIEKYNLRLDKDFINYYRRKT